MAEIARPPTSTVGLPYRRVNVGIAIAAAKFTMVVGMNARPACTGL